MKETINESVDLSDIYAQIPTYMKIEHQNIFTPRREAKILLNQIKRLQQEYVNASPEVLQMIIDSYILNLKEILESIKYNNRVIAINKSRQKKKSYGYQK